MLSFLVSCFFCLKHLIRTGYVLDPDILGRFWKPQCLADRLYHAVRRAKDQDTLRIDFLKSLPDFFSLLRIPENSAPDSLEPAFFALGRFSGHDSAVINKDSVVNDAGRFIFIGYNKSPVAFSCSGWTKKCYDFHCSPPSFLKNQSIHKENT